MSFTKGHPPQNFMQTITYTEFQMAKCSIVVIWKDIANASNFAWFTARYGRIL